MDIPEVTGVTHRTVLANGLRFHVAEAGAGLPLVLLHGFPQHWYTWRKLVPLLPGRRLIMPDLRGCGWTDAPRTGYDVDTLAGDVLALLDALDLPAVQLVGHDWGAKVGFRIRTHHPDRLTGLVALNTLPPHPARGPLIRHAWRQWHTALIEYPIAGARMLRRPAVVRFVLRRGVPDPKLWSDAELAAFVDPFNEPARARAGQQLHWQFVLRDIPRLLRSDQRRSLVPASLLHGASDRQFAAAQLSGAHGLAVHVIEGAGHHLPEERPELVAKEIRAQSAAAVGGWGDAAVRGQSDVAVSGGSDASIGARSDAVVGGWGDAVVRAQSEVAISGGSDAAVDAQDDAVVRGQSDVAVRAQGDVAVRAQGDVAVRGQSGAAVPAQDDAAVRGQRGVAVPAQKGAAQRPADGVGRRDGGGGPLRVETTGEAVDGVAVG